MIQQLDFLADLVQPAPSAIDPADAAPLEKLARELLRSSGSVALAGRVKVRWNPRMRSTAGMASATKALVTLNPRLVEFGWEEIDRTLRHELAHLLAQERAGRRRIAPHGREWQRACEALGLADEKRCHDLPLPRRNLPPRHHYRCPSCTVVIGRVRPLRRKSACLACCRRHNRGRYDERFRFEKIALPPRRG